MFPQKIKECENKYYFHTPFKFLKYAIFLSHKSD